MGRAREFDGGAVLDRAAEVFWRIGYDVVTVDDLEAATGLGRGSLYNAFGDKEALFLAALDHYVTKYGSSPFAHLANRDVAVGIRRLLDAVVARMNNPANPRGCLLTNTSLTHGTGSHRIDAAVAEKIKSMEGLLEAAIARARDEGQISAEAVPKQLARFYGAVIQSLGVMHKAYGDATVLRDIVTVAMQAWPGRQTRGRKTRRGRASPHG
jgi:TetR/AcrR family transcriptional repressor of nem operon